MTEKNVAPVICLLLFAPWIGEFLLGSSPLRNLPYIWLLIPIYGGGALLVREIAKHFSLGLAGIFCLAIAYGIIQAGLIDQSIFNAAYFGEVASDISAESKAVNALSYIAGHAIWSISVPIALTELLFPNRSGPWLRKRGLIFSSALYIAGCLIVFSITYAEQNFLASPYQLGGSALAALAIVIVAFNLKKACYNNKLLILMPICPWKMGVCSFVFSSIFAARPENWAGIVLGIILLVPAFLIILSWSNHAAWKIAHKFYLVAGALLTCAWLGFVVTFFLWPEDTLAWIGNITFAIIAIVLLIVIYKRIPLTQRHKRSARL